VLPWPYCTKVPLEITSFTPNTMAIQKYVGFENIFSLKQDMTTQGGTQPAYIFLNVSFIYPKLNTFL